MPDLTHTLSPVELRHLRLHSQHLHPTPPQATQDVAQIVKSLCGIQAQEASAARLAIRARSADLTAATVESTRVDARSVVRTWCMRGTLHLVAADDLGWLLPLLGPLFKASQRRYAQLGLTEEIISRAVRAIRDLLGRQGPLTRAELAALLTEKGIPTEGQATPHLLGRAALEGAICYGPDRAGKATYVLLEEWANIRLVQPDETTRGKLARRYLAGYGPAGPEDFAGWSGLSIGEARAGFTMIADELVEMEVGDSRMWMLRSQANSVEKPAVEEISVRLVPGYDPYLLGYRNRDLIVPVQHAKSIHPGGGVLHPTLLVNGFATGIWKSRRKKEGLVVSVEPFDSLGADVTSGLEAEVRDVGRFLELKATLDAASR